jgi:hypothetical protein
MSTLTPDYLSIDYSSLITRLKQQLRNSDTFADYNFEGANITILLELLAYVTELNTYFTNKVAKNVHIETADVYEAVNRAARQMGYEPKGAISSTTTLTITLTGAIPGNTYRLYPFSQFECPDEQDENGDTIKFSNTTLYTEVASSSTVIFEDVMVRQGIVKELTGYTGDDLIDNELFLPSNYAYDNNLTDDYPSLEVRINDVAWTRVPDFWDELSAYYTNDDVYMFVYDRYGRSKVVFSTSRNVPTDDDTIDITVLESLGANSNVGANSITAFQTNLIYDEDEGEYIDSEQIIEVVNDTASSGGQDAEDIGTIKENAKASLHTQYRNVTAVDYKAHLQERSDVAVAKAWGEQDVTPAGDITNYNLVYICLYPSLWSTDNINWTSTTFSTTWGLTQAIVVPTTYNSDWTTELSLYLEPRKMISAYETYTVLDLVYFSFDISVRVKRGYDFTLVQTDIINKLQRYFRATNQEFYTIINFNDIVEYLLDISEVGTSDNYDNIKGIRNLNIRDIEVSHTMYENNEVGNYPYYIEDSSTYDGDNQLRRIQLGLNQFPVLAVDTVRVTQED